MKKKLVKCVGFTSVVMMAMGCMAGCGNTSQSNAAAVSNVQEEKNVDEENVKEENIDKQSVDKEETDKKETDKKIDGTISLAGSTSMEKVCEALMEGFMEKYPEVTVTTEYTGSGAGMEAVALKKVDIGNASRGVKDEEKEKGVVENIIALDGIAVITSKDNAVGDLSKEQLTSIYKGEISNWNELGGEDSAIVVIGRENGSGTRSAFEELLKVEDVCMYAQELDSTGAVLAKVAATDGAIGYVSLDVVDETVKSVALDGVEASEANILDGKYILSRPFVMATNGEIEAQSDLVKTWFEYIKSDEGKEIISSVGLILPN